jgi:phosphatidylethanolamine-binding protein (PEBP) family uncharacterized protein
VTFDELMKPADHANGPDMAGIQLRSLFFGDHRPIPARHAVEGRNDFGEEGYGGPLPLVGDGPHRSFFRVYAASAPLGFAAGASAEDLRRALEGKELASGTLVGTYQR